MSAYIWLSFTKFSNNDIYVGVWNKKPMYVDNNNDWVGEGKLNNSYNNAEKNIKYINGSDLKNILITEYFVKKYYRNEQTLVKIEYNDFITELNEKVENTLIRITFDSKSNLDFFVNWYNLNKKENWTFDKILYEWVKFIENNTLKDTIK